MNKIFEISVEPDAEGNERYIEVEVDIKYTTAYDDSENVEVEDYRIIACINPLTGDDIDITPYIEEQVRKEVCYD